MRSAKTSTAKEKQGSFLVIVLDTDYLQQSRDLAIRNLKPDFLKRLLDRRLNGPITSEMLEPLKTTTMGRPIR